MSHEKIKCTNCGHEGHDARQCRSANNGSLVSAPSSSVSDTPLTDEESRCPRNGPYRRMEISIFFGEKLERAFNAACAFIDSHAADPDLTPEMCRTYAIFREKRRELYASLNDQLCGGNPSASASGSILKP